MSEEIDLNAAATLDPYLGQDFLTWLWFKSEKSSGMFRSASGEDFALYMEQRIAVQGGEGDMVETAVCSGPQAEMREARLGLTTGKKVNQARVRLEQDANAWQFQLKAEDFTFGSLKTPKVDMKQEEGDDPDGPFLEKIYLIEKALDFLDGLYLQFLRVRLSPQWREETQALRPWIMEQQ
mgnify:FL=1